MSISMKTESPRKLPARFLIFLVSLLMFAVPARAQEFGIDLKKIPKPAEQKLLPEADFNKQTKKVIETEPYNEPQVGYSVRLPKNWTDNAQVAPIFSNVGKSMLSDTVLGIVGRYISAPRNLFRSYLTIEAQTLTYEVSAQNWFVNFTLNSGFSLTALEEKNSREVEALYVQVIKDQTYVVRSRVIMNGSSLIVVRYYLPQEIYEDEKAQQEQIVDSFTLLQPTSERIEKQAQYGFLDQSYFNYPESWTLKEKSILSVERMSALLYQATRAKGTLVVLDGHIKILVVSRLLKTTLGQEIGKFREELKIPKYKVGNLIENVKYDHDPSIKSSSAQIYRLVPDDPVNMKEYEFLVNVMEGDDYYYITSMITPSRQEDFYTWAQNMEAAKIINESMRRSNVSLEYDPNDPYFDYLKEQ